MARERQVMAARLDGPDPATLHVRIQLMRRRHLRAVLRIESQVYPRPWSLGLFMSELALGPSRAYRVARVGHSVVGYGGIMLAGDEAHVTTIAVDPAWQRCTIGTRMMLVLAREALARGATGLTLEVRESNEGAQEMYRRFGFVPAGVRKNYYSDVGEDAVVMWAYDIATPEYDARLSALAAVLPTPTLEEPHP